MNEDKIINRIRTAIRFCNGWKSRLKYRWRSRDDTFQRMNMALGAIGYDCPLREISGWKFFVDDNGFIPSGGNTLLVAKVFAWKGLKDNFYAAAIGNDGPGGTIRYDKTKNLPASFLQVKITTDWFRENKVKGVIRERESALQRLVDLVCRSEGIAQ